MHSNSVVYRYGNKGIKRKRRWNKIKSNQIKHIYALDGNKLIDAHLRIKFQLGHFYNINAESHDVYTLHTTIQHVYLFNLSFS